MEASPSPLSSREPVTFSIFSCFSCIQAPGKAVILSEALRRSIANRGFMARSRRTPAMLVGRCFWELSDRKLQRKIKKSQPPSEAEGSAVSLHPQPKHKGSRRSLGAREDARGEWFFQSGLSCTTRCDRLHGSQVSNARDLGHPTICFGSARVNQRSAITCGVFAPSETT